MNSQLVETLIGTIVLIIAAAFLAFAYSASGVSRSDGYEVLAEFGRIDGLSVGADVRISGIKVGSVVGEGLDPTTFRARVRLRVNSNVELPDDSSVKIAMEGLLGGNYLAIEPGGSDTAIKDGGRIKYTQGSIDLMGLLGRAVFGSAESGPQGPAAGSSSPPGQNATPAPAAP